MKSLKERLQPDHSALVVLIEHDAEHDPEEVRKVIDGAMSQPTLVDTLVQELLAAEHPSVPA